MTLPAQGTVDAERLVEPILELDHVNVYYGQSRAVKDVSMAVRPNTVHALIGASGCGKTTLLRSLNRMHDLTKGARVEGRVLFEGQDIYDRSIDPVAVRRVIGMVFQKPNPFPTMSVYDNVVAGLKLAGRVRRAQLDEVVERSLAQAALWDEVKDRLHAPATGLSGGQQQRLCIARSLAVDPAVLLMDEPTSALDPQATARIEELLAELKRYVTIVIVTHNMQQAGRVSDRTAFMHLGELIEQGPTDQIFTRPQQSLTERYISGHFG
ncbi:MAG TPA: phosphate ABC transporter ATP-binding protein PstB [Trueperaceae bacterium]|nr:phosphate ABC transporter ATP-binding protein PstB [Trueperaceae bacterium]